MNIDNATLVRILETILIIVIDVVIYLVVRFLINRRTAKMKRGKRLTYLRLLRSIIKYVLIIAGILTILQINGINTGSIVAGLGIASVIAGLALQDALKDIIMGFNIIADNYFSAGDVIKIGDITGKVIEIGLKATKIRNLINDNIEVIANRNISSSAVVSKWLDIDLPLPYEEELERIEKFLEVLTAKIKDCPGVEGIEYKGINDFADSAIVYKLRIFVRPDIRLQVGRDVRCIIKRELDKAHISIPYQQIEISTKK